MRLDHDGGTHNLVAGRKLRARMDRGLVPAAAGIEPRRALGPGQRTRCRRQDRFGEFGAAADRLDCYGFDHQLLLWSTNPKRAWWRIRRLISFRQV